MMLETYMEIYYIYIYMYIYILKNSTPKENNELQILQFCPALLF